MCAPLTLKTVRKKRAVVVVVVLAVSGGGDLSAGQPASCSASSSVWFPPLAHSQRNPTSCLSLLCLLRRRDAGEGGSHRRGARNSGALAAAGGRGAQPGAAARLARASVLRCAVWARRCHRQPCTRCQRGWWGGAHAHALHRFTLCPLCTTTTHVCAAQHARGRGGRHDPRLPQEPPERAAGAGAGQARTPLSRMRCTSLALRCRLGARPGAMALGQLGLTSACLPACRSLPAAASAWATDRKRATARRLPTMRSRAMRGTWWARRLPCPPRHERRPLRRPNLNLSLAMEPSWLPHFHAPL